jgi:5,10-methylenetetrahydrofolate reductase
MIFNPTFESNSLQQFQKLWEKIATLNTHITLVNKEIEIVKSHIQELIGIDVSNLATFGDLSNLEDNLKHYTDAAVNSVDLSDYATKKELSDYLTKSDMCYEGYPTKDLRIKYKTQEVHHEANHKNNIYIGGFFS